MKDEKSRLEAFTHRVTSVAESLAAAAISRRF